MGNLLDGKALEEEDATSFPLGNRKFASANIDERSRSQNEQVFCLCVRLESVVHSLGASIARHRFLRSGKSCLSLIRTFRAEGMLRRNVVCEMRRH
jgi:hypothetical protein